MLDSGGGMAIRVAETGALASLEYARAKLESCQSTDEVLQIKAVAQAAASVAAGREIKTRAQAIVLLAMARLGELTEEVKAPKVEGKGRKGVRRVPVGNTSRTETLAAHGLSRKVAAECEALAKLKGDGRLDKALNESAGVPSKAKLLRWKREEDAKNADVIPALSRPTRCDTATRHNTTHADKYRMKIGAAFAQLDQAIAVLCQATLTEMQARSFITRLTLGIDEARKQHQEVLR